MSVTIRYRDPKRPDGAGMTMISDRAKAEAMVDQLEKRGFLIEKITYAPFARSAQAD
jgi:hypothetical protein